MRRNKYSLLRVISMIAFLLLWQAFSMLNKRVEIMNPNFMPGPYDIILTMLQYIREGTFFSSVGSSLQRVLKGFFIGSIIAMVLGYFMAKHPVIENILDPVFSAVGSIPTYAFMPLFIIWFGIGERTKIIMIVYSTALPLLTYIIQGIKSVDPILIRSAMSLGANELQVFFNVIIKSAMPHILTGMEVSLGLTFSALIVAEMMGADSGLGYIIVFSRNWFKVADMFMAMACIGILYSILKGILTLIKKRVLRWQMTSFDNAVE
ncbi:MAG: ABC transporter permease [Lachnospiraceae bacterium]|nr:ABC transporter permease [Lachnospiraceae bacterium]